MKVQSFLVAWDDVRSNSKSIEKQFKKFNQDITVINSGEQKDGWKNLGDIRYYRQMYYALKNFDYSNEYLLFICGDLISDDWEKVFNRAIDVMSSYSDIHLYSPHFTYDPWNFDSTNIKVVDNDQKLSIATNTNGMMFFMHKDLVKSMLLFFDYFQYKIGWEGYVSGWGVDVVASAIAIANNKFVIRDSEIIVTHPQGSSYNHDKATGETANVYNAFNNMCQGIENGESMIDKLNKINLRMSRDKSAKTMIDFYGVDKNLEEKKVEINYHVVTISDERKNNIERLDSVINGSKLSIPCLNAKIDGNIDKFFKENPEIKLTWPSLKPGEIGCFGSHYLAWKYLNNSDLDMISVFEDDILVHDNFIEQYKSLIRHAPDDWDIISIFVDQNQHPRFDKTQEINYYIAKGYQDWSTLGYIISKNGARKICNFVEEHGMNQPVDWYIFRNGHAGNFNVYTVPPYIKCSLEIDHTHVSLVQE